ncbi:hypothetical protein KIPE111705_04525 [Kibdelosporangium persicum]|uniref:Repetin n=1 Tax=Kibdelosporangium persicum TaxID=2698649 RepID=A0ABX2F595_9PSEU|nr:hypothetical protein [Kibdelosporangium persicum]NRN66477.1 Repetin [Kibdelosporangium persicum]
MNRLFRRTIRIAVAGVAIAALGLVMPAAAKPVAAKPTEPSLVGSGTLHRSDGQYVRFTFDAHGLSKDARGTFTIQHDAFWARGRIDCLIVGGPVAIATGVITESSQPAFHDVRRGFTVYDHGRHDRLGYSWLFDPGSLESVPECVGMAPFETVERGDFRAVEWLPLT